MSLSICIYCGTVKASPLDKCSKCGRIPQSDSDKAKSLILSLNYEINGEYKGQTKERLLEIGELIKHKHFTFDDAEVNSVIAYAHKVLSVPASTLIKAGLKWLVLPAVLLALMVLILILRSH
jgi:hypothetical protein